MTTRQTHRAILAAFAAALIAAPGLAQGQQPPLSQTRPNEGTGSSARMPATTGTGAAQGQTDPGANLAPAPGAPGTPGGTGTAGSSATGGAATNRAMQEQGTGSQTAVPNAAGPAGSTRTGGQPGMSQGTTAAPAGPMDAAPQAAPGTIRPQGAPDPRASDQRGGQHTGSVIPGRDGATRDANAPVPGANSFTEGQARGRAEARGFTDVGDLTLDENGIWRGRAAHAGRPVEVMIDFQGNVTAR